MKKGQQVEGVVTRVDFPNKGIVQTDDGDLITVQGSDPSRREGSDPIAECTWLGPEPFPLEKGSGPD